MNQETRTYVLFSTTTKIVAGVSTQLDASRQEYGYINLTRPPVAATFYANVITASGTIKIVVQRGIRAMDAEGPGTILLGSTYEWFDWASFTTTTTVGKMVLSMVRTTTTNNSAAITSTGTMLQNNINGGSIGTVFRGAAAISGASPTFTFNVVGEFEF